MRCQKRKILERRITMLMKVRQTGQVTPSAATLFAQFSQNRAWPHGTRANPSLHRGGANTPVQLLTFLVYEN